MSSDTISEQENSRRKIKERIVSSFLDYIVLGHYLKGGTFSGYDVLQFIHQQYGFFISTGTVYSTLYSMERNGLLGGLDSAKKRLFNVTDKGKFTYEVASSASDIETLMAKVFSLQTKIQT